MNIFESLREDHDKQRTLSDLLVKTHGDSEGREELFTKLKVQLQAHAAAEERHFYKPLIDHDNTQEMARHGIAEHHEMDELIETLEETDRESPKWLATAKKLRDKVHHHLEDEEHTFFQQAGKVMSESQKKKLGESYRAEMDEAQKSLS